jgi:UDPglucose 6-dehydrogenase
VADDEHDGGSGVTRICVTGIWHQGAVVAACLADLEHDVVGLCDPVAARRLAAGEPLVHEPELPELLRAGLASGRLRFTSDAGDALRGAELVFLSTDTPVGDDDSPELESVYALAETIRDGIGGDIVLCVSAQVPVGTTSALAATVAGNAAGHRCAGVYVPEFLRLGEAVRTFREADRFVVGAADEEAGARVAALLEPMGRPVVRTDINSAEMAKHASNAYLATSISFMNEIADICGVVGADAAQVAAILKLDKRIGSHAYLSPGLGYAGGTLGRELRVLQEIGTRERRPTQLTDAVVAVNDARPVLVTRQLRSALGGLEARKIAVHGLAYKSGTSTLRRAISIAIVKSLVEGGATVAASDALADFDEAEELIGSVDLYRDPHDAASGSDALVVFAHEATPALDFARLNRIMRGDVILDARSSLRPTEVRSAGLRYASLWGIDE